MNLALSLALCLSVQEVPEKASPFTAVRWEGDTPVVQFEGEWYEFVSLNGLSREKLVAFFKEEHDDKWKKAFGEDLVETLEEMGNPLQSVKVELVLAKDGEQLTKAGTLTEDNRRAVWKYNRANPGQIEAPRSERPERSERRRRTASSSRTPLWQFEFESARIVFRWTGDVEGKDILHVADKGQTMVLQREKKVAFWDRRTSIWKDGTCTSWDPDKKKVISFRYLPRDMKLSVAHARDATLKQIGFVNKGTEEVAGKPCVLWEKIKDDTVWRSWRWKGIELKIEAKNLLGTTYVKEAVEVEEGVEIPAELFKVPEGYSK